jgi:flagellar biosynthesis protein FlhG
MSTDQASTLRRIANGADAGDELNQETSRRQRNAPASRTIAVTSGKGGVGKTNFSVNIALELAALGRRVSLLDADLGLANSDVLLGVNPQYHLGHLISGQRTLDEILITSTRGLRLIPGGSGIEELANLTQSQYKNLIAELRAIEQKTDIMLIDTASGIANNVIGVLRAASEVVIVTTPYPTAIVDAYATIKVLHQRAAEKRIRVVVNDVAFYGDADKTFDQINTAAQLFLKHPLEFLGAIPHDEELAEAVRRQQPVVECAPEAAASRALRLIAKRLEQTPQTPPHHDSTDSFWDLLAESSPFNYEN